MNKQIAWFLHALDTPLGHDIVQEFRDAATEAAFPTEPYVTWAQTGQFEELTINRLRLWSQENPDSAVLYTHTKGAFRPDAVQPVWRGVMIDRLIRAWPGRLADLRTVDVSAPYWLSADTMGEEIASTPWSCGNFWWARSDYLATLPEIPALTEDNRAEAEAWLGRENPSVRAMEYCWPRFSVPGVSQEEWDAAAAR